MKSKINLFTRFATLAALTLFFFASTRSVAANSFVPPRAAEIIPWPARAIDPIDFQRLLDQAQKKGSVRVIVGLRMNYQPEAQLGLTRAVDLQRQVVDLGQTALINRMAAHNIKGVKRIKNLPFVAMKVDANALAILNALQEVNSINEDAPHFPTLAESTVLIGATTAWANGYSGQGQVVAILDTGVDKTHPFLAGKVVAEGCFSTTDPADYATSVCPGGVQSSTAPGSGVPCNAGCDHGTHVAGIAAGKGASFSGVARDAKIIAIQVFTRFDDPNFCGSTAPCVAAYTSDIIQGLQQVYTYASSYTIASANMSLGGGSYTSNCDSADAATKTAIDNLRSIKIATVIASGNESKTNAISSPGCISTAISVGSTRDGSLGTTADTVSSFSNSASFLNLLAPGEYIYSSIPGGAFANYRGTSMAAPHVAGAWAVVKSKLPTASVDQVLNALATTGASITDSRNGIVKPRIRVDAALNTFSGLAPTVTPTVNGTGVGAGTYDDNDSRIGYSTGWTAYTWYQLYNGTQHYSTTPGSSAQLIFTGTQVSVVHTQASSYGVLNVMIDGALVGTIVETGSLQWQVQWNGPGLANGTHTLTLVHASGSTVDIDAIIVNGATASATATSTSGSGGGAIAGCPVFPADNAWNRDVSNDPVDANSAAYIARINENAQYLHADFGASAAYGIPYIVVPGSQAKVPITFTEYASESDAGPYPVPANAPIEAGSDAHVLVVNSGECKLYEMYHASKDPNSSGWFAGSGAVFDLRSNALRPEGWTSADAAGLAIFPGLARYDEVTAGEIKHALRFTVYRSQRAYIHPATHFASSITDPSYPPMGMRVRLKASYNISSFTGQSRVVLNALKKYGMMVADNGSSWFISGATDSRWNDNDLNQLKTVPGNMFEVVQLGQIYK